MTRHNSFIGDDWILLCEESLGHWPPRAGDFPEPGVTLEFADGSSVTMKYALAFIAPDQSGVCVLTEHNGYRLFESVTCLHDHRNDAINHDRRRGRR